MTNKVLKFAVFGAGRMGTIHLQNLYNFENVQLVGLCDPYKDNISDIAKKFGTTNLTEEEIFLNNDIDAVVIASDASTHFNLIKRAIEAGKHIFCEKPIDTDLANVKKIYQLSKSSSLKIGIGFHRRFDKSFFNLKQRIDAGEIGKVDTVIINSKDPYWSMPKDSKGSYVLIKEMMIHDLDMVDFLVDDEIVSVYARGSNLVRQERGLNTDIDSASVLITTKLGAMITIINNRRSAYGYDQRVEVFGEFGRLNVDNVPQNYVTTVGADGQKSAIGVEYFTDRYNETYKTQMFDYVNWLLNKGDFNSKLETAVHSSLLAQIVIDSINSQKPISIRNYEAF